MNINATIWTKPNCTYCTQAKNLFERKNISYEEKIIGDGVTVEQLKELVPSARTVPQIWLNDNYIGGFQELAAFFQNAGA